MLEWIGPYIGECCLYHNRFHPWWMCSSMDTTTPTHVVGMHNAHIPYIHVVGSPLSEACCKLYFVKINRNWWMLQEDLQVPFWSHSRHHFLILLLNTNCKLRYGVTNTKYSPNIVCHSCKFLGVYRYTMLQLLSLIKRLKKQVFMEASVEPNLDSKKNMGLVT